MTSNRKIFCTAIFAVIIVLLYACADKTPKTVTPPAKTKDGKTVAEGKWEPFPLGDMDGDSVRDTAYVYTSPYYETPFEGQPGDMEFAGCVNDTCYNRIKFSAGYPEIWQGNSLWGTVEPIADLDEDGIKEFIFQTNWWIGSRATIYVYSFDRKKRQWLVLANNWVYAEDSYRGRIKKINKSQFKFNIEYTFEGEMLKKDTVIWIRK